MQTKNKTGLKKSPFIWVFLAALLIPCAAQADAPRITKPEKNAHKDVDPLKAMVSLPDVPEYTGQVQFLYGYSYESPRGPCYIMKMRAKEEPKQVIDWYAHTLNSYKWRVTFMDETSVTATKDGNNCAIWANDIASHKNGNRSEIAINYMKVAKH